MSKGFQGFQSGHPVYYHKYTLDDSKIAKAYRSGSSIREIAEFIGVSTCIIRNSLIRNEVEMRKGGFPKGHIPWCAGTHGLMNTWNKDLKNCFSEEVTDKISEGNKGKHFLHNLGLIRSQEERDNISNTIRKKLENKEYFEYRSRISKENLRKAREDGRLIIPKQDTTIEIKIQEFLSKLHIEYIAHKYISDITHSYNCDIFIPEQEGITQKTIIECDGCYWHGCLICKKGENEFVDNTREIDLIKNKELQEQGFKVIRLWEHQIRPMQLNELKGVLYG